MTARNSNSSISEVGIFRRFSYLAGLARLYLDRYREGDDFTWLHAALGDYRAMLDKYGSKKFEDCRVLEIGFGARPLRLMALNALGVDAIGVDLDKPIVHGSPSEFIAIWRKNGAERALKSFARFWINDRRERRSLIRDLGGTATEARLPVDRLIVSSASEPAFWQGLPGPLDLVISEDVFEHIPRDGLERVVAEMREALAPGGIALIRPMVFSGISGGHHLEWYPHLADRDIERETAPWEHLRENRHPANTYLNGMLRRDYRDLFAPHFEIVEECVQMPDLGRGHMTPEIRAELAAYTDEELFSNNVMFVLRPRS